MDSRHNSLWESLLARIQAAGGRAKRVPFRNTAERENAPAMPDRSEFNRENANDTVSWSQASPVLR
jgi:hypothetical protein